MKVLLMGDIGADVDFHVGDEAMLEGALRELRSRLTVDFTVISADPAASAARYDVRSIDRLGFAALADRASRDDRLDRIVAAARGHAALLEADDAAWPVIETVADSDAVVIAGGGNLNSSFVEHVYERAALAALCDVFGTRLVVSGQSLGPALTARDAELVGGILASARLVGAREAESFALALELGARADTVFHTIDDASFLGTDDAAAVPDSVIERLGLTKNKYVVLSFPEYGGVESPAELATALKQLISDVKSVTKLKVVLVPHQGSLDGAASVHDDAMTARLQGPGVLVAPLLVPSEVAALTGGAALSISARYHPAVFALSAGVPAIGVWLDDYTRRKITGALENFGAGAYAVPVSAIHTGLLRRLVESTWAERAPIRAALVAAAGARREDAAAWWDAVASVVSGVQASPRSLLAIPAIPAPADDVVQEIDELARWTKRAFETNSALTVELVEAREQIARLESALANLDAELTTLRKTEGDPVELNAIAAAVAEASGSDATQAQIEALEQRLWERERLAAARGRELSDLRIQLAMGERASREAIDAVMSSASWRLTLPLRAARHPRYYLRTLRDRRR